MAAVWSSDTSGNMWCCSSTSLARFWITRELGGVGRQRGATAPSCTTALQKPLSQRLNPRFTQSVECCECGMWLCPSGISCTDDPQHPRSQPPARNLNLSTWGLLTKCWPITEQTDTLLIELIMTEILSLGVPFRHVRNIHSQTHGQKTHCGWVRGVVVRLWLPAVIIATVRSSPCIKPASNVISAFVCIWDQVHCNGLLNGRLRLEGINISVSGGKIITLIKWLTWYKPGWTIWR